MSGSRLPVTTVTVVALASCSHSSAAIVQSDDSWNSATPVTDTLLTDAARVSVDLRVVDVDGIPINVSVPNAAVLWGIDTGSVKEMVPARPSACESNILTAIIDASLRRTPGLYRLQVVLRDGWNETLGAVGACVLLDHTVLVEQPARPNDAWIYSTKEVAFMS